MVVAGLVMVVIHKGTGHANLCAHARGCCARRQGSTLAALEQNYRTLQALAAAGAGPGLLPLQGQGQKGG